jgi:acetamidase/formamidase
MITMAFDPSLDAAAMVALRQMVDLVAARTGLDRYQAYQLNQNKGIHVMVEKRYLTRQK